MAREWLNECRIVEIHEHTLDTDILIQVHEYPVFMLSDVQYSPHQPHKEEGIEHYRKHDIVQAKFVSHDEVSRTGMSTANIGFGIGTPNIEPVNCRGRVVEVIAGGEQGGNTVVVDVGREGHPLYVYAIDRNQRKVSTGEFVQFHKIHQIVVRHIVTDRKVMDTTQGKSQFFYAFKCANCGVEGMTTRSSSKELIEHKVYFDRDSKKFFDDLGDAGEHPTPLYAGNRVCPNCQTAGLEWDFRKVDWRRSA